MEALYHRLPEKGRGNLAGIGACQTVEDLV
jgi:hypothetical protein